MGLQPWKNKAENFAENILPSKFAEKFAGNFLNSQDQNKHFTPNRSAGSQARELLHTRGNEFEMMKLCNGNTFGPNGVHLFSGPMVSSLVLLFPRKWHTPLFFFAL